MFDFLTTKFSAIFSKLTGKGTLTESDVQETLAKVKDALLEADVPYQLVTTFCDEIAQEVVGQKVLKALKPAEQLITVVHKKLESFLAGQENAGRFAFSIPGTVMVMGLQGSGKTTSIAKMAYLALQEAQQKGKKLRILLASVDFYRPAAVDQLEVLSRQCGADFYRAVSTDPVAASLEIKGYAASNRYDLLFLDTAGRLHVDNQLLAQLREIDVDVHPNHKLLVLDAMTGQESLQVAQAFEQAVGFTGAILTKMDSDTRAGAAFAFRYSLKKPILFMGTGEKIGDFERLYPERLAGKILGMGDVQTLVEKADAQIKEEDQKRMYEKVMSGSMTLKDFADQMAMMSKLGSISQIVKYIPGLGGADLSQEKMTQGEQEINRFRAIINSMTPKERLDHKILDGSRKKRIAKGAGVDVQSVNQLLQRFEQTQQYAKLLKKSGRFPGFFK